MLENNLLKKFYRHSAPLIRNSEQVTLLIDNLAHENSNLRVREIGAGIGGVTLSILEKLGEVPKDLIVIQSHQFSQSSLELLKEKLSAILGRAPWILSLAQISHLDVKHSHCIFLDELEHPILANLSASDFQAIQTLCSAAGILWVVQGGQMESSTPESSMAVGLARCIRSENPAIRLVTLDLDERQKFPASRTSEVIANLYQAAFTSITHSEGRSPESEYVKREGCLYIPRVV